MKKAMIGLRLKRLREERKLTQEALARAIGISLSYLNQLENNQRPLTLPVLFKLNTAFGVAMEAFSEDEQLRLISDLREALADPALGEAIAAADIRELATNMPAVGRALVTLHRRYRNALEQSAALASRLGADRESETALLPSTAFEEVRDFFYARHNYFASLDEAAEHLAADIGIGPGSTAEKLATYLRKQHGVAIEVLASDGNTKEEQRCFLPDQRILKLSGHLQAGQQAFQMATQIAFLERGDLIEALAVEASFANPESRALARIGLANYFAGALIMPYLIFRNEAETTRYDIERLGQRFGVEFETTCHQLSTLQRPGAPGVPFFFVRVDRAGNISKRQSATDFHFSRFGGTCPLWNVYEAFAQPGKILTQLARMPDERTYLWVALVVSRKRGGFLSPQKTFAIALGCDVQHAERLIYSDGLDLKSLSATTPIGAGCKICERAGCPQRAFPPIGRALHVDETRSSFSPYAVKQSRQS